jgi:hypothetical protein
VPCKSGWRDRSRGKGGTTPDHTIAFDDLLVMRFPQCVRCGAPIVWLDILETAEGPRCVGLCRRCLTAMRQRGAALRPAQEA